MSKWIDTMVQRPPEIKDVAASKRKPRAKLTVEERALGRGNCNDSHCKICESSKGALLCCDGCPASFHIKCLGMKKIPDTDVWLCTECHLAQHEDFCDICNWGGELLCCDLCSKGFHLKCLKLKEVPDGFWCCHHCKVEPFELMEGVKNDIPAQTKQFHDYGLTTFKACLTEDQVLECYNTCIERMNEAFEVVKRLGLQQELEDVGFTTFKTRNRSRYDLHIPEFMKTTKFPYLNKKAAWLPMVEKILGKDFKLIHTGVMMNLPGSETQPFHMDGPHKNEKKHKPAHVLNVFLPLVDLKRSVGPTEFVPTSHILGNFHESGHKSVVPLVDAGTGVVMDYRIRHRGLGNSGTEPRPLVYITYGAKGYVDKKNFSGRRYKKLPRLADLAGGKKKR